MNKEKIEEATAFLDQRFSHEFPIDLNFPLPLLPSFIPQSSHDIGSFGLLFT
jgi:hypothetical protein